MSTHKHFYGEIARPGGSVGCSSDVITRLLVQSPLGTATFFHGDGSTDDFYSHSLPSADSGRAVVSFWQKNVHKYWLTPEKIVSAQEKWSRKLTGLT